MFRCIRTVGDSADVGRCWLRCLPCKTRARHASGRRSAPSWRFGSSCLACSGFVQIVREPQVLLALDPLYALRYAAAQPGKTFVVMGAVFLALTGAEALYADMGHFGSKPIRIAWFWLVMPCLVLNYFGQGALVLTDEKAASNPFFLLAPGWLQFPLVILATAATVIASQAVISGAFSITSQAIKLGYLPRMQVDYTSETEAGQIYVPLINFLLLRGRDVAGGRASAALRIWPQRMGWPWRRRWW